jgi:hypothetical protein
MLHTFTRRIRKCTKCKEPVDINYQLKQVEGTIRHRILEIEEDIKGCRGWGIEKEIAKKATWVNYWIVF